MTKNINTEILHKSYEKKIQKQKQKNERDCMRGNEGGTNFPKIVKYKSPSRSKLNNLTG